MRFLGFVGKKRVLSIVLDDSGRLCDIDDPNLNSVGLDGVIIEVGVSFLPSLAEDLSESGMSYIPSKESGCTTWLS